MLRDWWFIPGAVETIPAGPLQEQANGSGAGVTRWLQNAYRLAYHTDQLQWQAVKWQPPGTGQVNAEIRQQVIEAYQQLDETAAELRRFMQKFCCWPTVTGCPMPDSGGI